MASIVYLDTHVAVWLYYGRVEMIPSTVRAHIESNDLLISPMVALELQYLREIGRISAAPEALLKTLSETLGLQLCALPFDRVVEGAIDVTWTRDPFDRIIVAHAVARGVSLLTKDRSILDRCPLAVWS